jgi:hypothetical protein
MDTLRAPFFVLALVLLVIVVTIDLGAAAVLKGTGATTATVAEQLPSGPVKDSMQAVGPGEIERLSSTQTPPGLSIPYMAAVDGVALFTVALMGVSLLIRERLQARLQGCATLIFSVVLIVAGIAAIFAALGALILMVSLLLAVPFGTIAYLAIYGFFDRAGAAVVLSLLMALKVGALVCLVLAQQRFLQNKGLVLILLSSLAANVVVGFLHGLAPGFLVSITDAVGAIVLGICGVLWALLLLVGALPAILKALRSEPA